LTAISGKPTDKEPATAVAIKSRRETVIHPPRKINATKVPARKTRKPTTLSTSTTPLTPQKSIVILRQRSREPKRATPNEGSLYPQPRPDSQRHIPESGSGASDQPLSS
jgi:hypothetical protein